MSLARDWWLPRLTWRTLPLLPVSWLYGAAMRLRRALYAAGHLRSSHLPVPVVIVGNLTVGGSGKTPLTVHLVGALRARGLSPGVVSRGYGRPRARRPDTVLEVDPDGDAATYGDEPLLIRRRAGCPVFVAAARVAAAHALLAAHPETDVIVADDGLQHLALARTFEIAVVDPRGRGNGRLLPAGPWREPYRRFDEVDAVVAHAGSARASGAYAMSYAQDDLYNLARPERTCPAGEFRDRVGARVAAVAGIGNPGRFFAALRALGLEVDEHPFTDHHRFAPGDLAGIAAPVIVMTEKDAIKCGALSDPRIWVAPATARVDPALVDALVERLRGHQAAGHSGLPDHEGTARLRP
ncbi:MAG: tetraacyldisaccharide 4'-kinase [Burkholderiales bacterium]|nr:tetraacyldisaccharide 4'-kinase [Burkholderiales bacterium]